MPLIKIGDAYPYCSSTEHEPPRHIVLEPGQYQYTCPQCGRSVMFYVRRVTS